VAATLAHIEAPLTLISDVEPAVASWRSSIADINVQLNGATEALRKSVPRLGRIIWISNSDLRGIVAPRGATIQVSVVASARKPFVRGLANLIGDAAATAYLVVVGDQWWTDGLLAARLRCQFILWEATCCGMPIWPRFQLATAVRPLRAFVSRKTLGMMA
jgi:predicted HAD superfamily phosphohydrolase YqeG